MNLRPWLGIAVLALAGCAAHAPASTLAPQRAKRRLQLEPFKLIASADRSDIEVLDATGLFEAGGRFLGAKRYREALKRYDRLLTHFHDTRYGSPALYNSGLAHEALYEFDKAVLRYRELIRRHGATRDAVDASFRMGGCLAELQRWADSAKVFIKLLDRKDLSAGDRIEAYARAGLAYFRRDDFDATRKTLQAAIAYAQKIDGVERLDNDFFLGMSYYYLAAIPHLSFRTSKVDAGKTMGQQLDAKARWLLLSQRRYIETIRVKNPYWATAAGFQIGSLYREFYDTLMTTVPDFKRVAAKNAKRAKITVAAAERQLVRVYVEELHKKVKPLLKKAIRVFERNVVMGTRVGIRSQWVSKSRRQIHELKRLLLAKPADVVKLLPRKAVLPEDQPGTPGSAPTTMGAPPSDPGTAPAPAATQPQSQPSTRRVIL